MGCCVFSSQFQLLSKDLGRERSAPRVTCGEINVVWKNIINPSLLFCDYPLFHLKVLQFFWQIFLTSFLKQQYLLSIQFMHEERHRKRKKCQLLDNSMEEVVTLGSVTVETGSGFLSGAWALFMWVWDRQGNPAFVPHLLCFSGFLSLLCFIGKAFLLLINLFQQGLAFALSL